jgi:hypothetical protein
LTIDCIIEKVKRNEKKQKKNISNMNKPENKRMNENAIVQKGMNAPTTYLVKRYLRVFSVSKMEPNVE